MKPPPDDLDDQAEGEREIVDTEGGCALPPIFSRDGEDDETTDEPIEYVYVFKKQPSKQMAFIDFRPVAQLQDLSNLLEQFGPGTYTIQGRAANRGRTLKQVAVVVGSEHGDVAPRAGLEHVPRGQFDLARFIEAAAASPLIALITTMLDKREAARREERELERRRIEEDRRRDDERNERYMTLMTQLMKARNEDLETIVREKQQASAPSSARERSAYEDGLAAAMEMLKSAREEGLTGDDLESRLVGLAEAFVAGRKKAESDIVDPNGAANS